MGALSGITARLRHEHNNEERATPTSSTEGVLLLVLVLVLVWLVVVAVSLRASISLLLRVPAGEVCRRARGRPVLCAYLRDVPTGCVCGAVGGRSGRAQASFVH